MTQPSLVGMIETSKFFTCCIIVLDPTFAGWDDWNSSRGGCCKAINNEDPTLTGWDDWNIISLKVQAYLFGPNPHGLGWLKLWLCFPFSGFIHDPTLAGWDDWNRHWRIVRGGICRPNPRGFGWLKLKRNNFNNIYFGLSTQAEWWKHPLMSCISIYANRTSPTWDGIIKITQITFIWLCAF